MLINLRKIHDGGGVYLRDSRLDLADDRVPAFQHFPRNRDVLNASVYVPDGIEFVATATIMGLALFFAHGRNKGALT